MIRRPPPPLLLCVGRFFHVHTGIIKKNVVVVVLSFPYITSPPPYLPLIGGYEIRFKWNFVERRDAWPPVFSSNGY